MSGTAAGFNSYRFYSPIVLKKKAAKEVKRILSNTDIFFNSVMDQA